MTRRFTQLTVDDVGNARRSMLLLAVVWLQLARTKRWPNEVARCAELARNAIAGASAAEAAIERDHVDCALIAQRIASACRLIEIAGHSYDYGDRRLSVIAPVLRSALKDARALAKAAPARKKKR